MPDMIIDYTPGAEQNEHPSEKQTGESPRLKDAALLSPASIALMTLMAGPHISLPACLKVLSCVRAGNRPKLFLIPAAIVFPVLYVFLVLWPTQWYWSSLTLIVAHLICAVAYYVYFRRLYLSYTNGYRTSYAKSRRKGQRFVVAGIAGGLVLIPLLGTPFIIAFLLGIDRLFSTLMPVAFNDILSLVLLVFGIIGLSISGAIAGGRVGRLGLQISPVQLISISLGLVWIVLLWFLFLQLTIILPGFITIQINNNELVPPLITFLIGYLFIGCWWSAHLLLYALHPSTVLGQGIRFLKIPCISFSSALIFALVCGYPSNWFHGAGKYFEKEGRIATSLWCYERGMSKKPSGFQASYLQYRIALLAYKLGEKEKAAEGFRKVVSIYNLREDLVTNSTKFLENLERNSGKGKRVVLPGVENPTAYKAAYCVPNSLALVMRYWGADVDARDIGRSITGLDSGTMVVDQAWYAEQRGFRHDFLPTASIADIISSIDAGFPVLVYVPSHVFAIVGYDQTLETFVTYDVATKDIWVD